MMSTVNASMQAIVDRSLQRCGIVAMIDSVAFQTNILALNAAISSRENAGERRFAVVVMKWAAGEEEQPFDADHPELISRSLQGIEDGHGPLTVWKITCSR